LRAIVIIDKASCHLDRIEEARDAAEEATAYS
jgi:hypothetical protein